MALLLVACATPKEMAPDAVRNYMPCTTLDNCISVVRDVITRNWIDPTSGSQPQLRVLLGIELDYYTKIRSVSVSTSSGDITFDNSAVDAVQRTVDLRELQGLDLATFENNFKFFYLQFQPPKQ
jgi:colicin import membrane protein